jgi:hypothetical protein
MLQGQGADCVLLFEHVLLDMASTTPYTDFATVDRGIVAAESVCAELAYAVSDRFQQIWVARCAAAIQPGTAALQGSPVWALHLKAVAAAVCDSRCCKTNAQKQAMLAVRGKAYCGSSFMLMLIAWKKADVICHLQLLAGHTELD